MTLHFLNDVANDAETTQKLDHYVIFASLKRESSKLINILNKSENPTPELFAIYIQNYANQECNGKCILMFKYWVMHNS